MTGGGFVDFAELLITIAQPPKRFDFIRAGFLFGFGKGEGLAQRRQCAVEILPGLQDFSAYELQVVIQTAHAEFVGLFGVQRLPDRLRLAQVFERDSRMLLPQFGLAQPRQRFGLQQAVTESIATCRRRA